MEEVKRYFLKEEVEIIDNIETYILLNNFKFVEYDFFKRDKYLIKLELSEENYRYKCYWYKYKTPNIQNFGLLAIEYIFDSSGLDCIRFVYKIREENFPDVKIFHSIGEFRDFLIELL